MITVKMSKLIIHDKTPRTISVLEDKDEMGTPFQFNSCIERFQVLWFWFGTLK